MSNSRSFHDVHQMVDKSMQVVRRILDQTKNPVVAGADVDHRYEDKYALVEFLTNTGIAATLNVLEQLDGFDEEVLKQICVVVQEQKRSMTLRLAVEEDCEFAEETLRTVESPTSHQVTKATTTVGSADSSTVYSHKVVQQVKEYHWKGGVRHSLVLFAGTDPKMGITLGSRTATSPLVTSMKKAPFPPTNRSPLDLDLTWLINQIRPATLEASFTIQRDEAKTPRRNQQTEEALKYIENLDIWSKQCRFYFCQTVPAELLRSQHAETKPADWLKKIESSNVFVPVVPLFQEYDTVHDKRSNDQNENVGMVSIPSPSEVSPILPLNDSTQLLREQSTSLANTILSLVGNFPDPADQTQITSGYEAKLVLLWCHLDDLAQQWLRCIHYVEEILYTQLSSAIGKNVRESEFNDFVKFHNQRLFGKAYAPKPFCHAIRQPNQFPEGELSIVALPCNKSSTDGVPIETFSRLIPGDSLVIPISIPLNAATTVEFMGDQYLHGWMDTQFASYSPDTFSISARARQFSCFLLMTGTISGPNEFKPSNAIIVQNKDQILIELLTTALPSAKEFRDAIKSLSPEQARFATAYRAMQLDSSIFGICIIQVKPQLEALLDLPPNSLIKEIKLSQDLMSLFVEFQIPPSLVSYDGDVGAIAAEKVAVVKQHVKGVQDVITGVKQDQLQEEKRKADMRVEMNTTERRYKDGRPEDFVFDDSLGGPARRSSPSQGVIGPFAPLASVCTASMGRAAKQFSTPTARDNRFSLAKAARPPYSAPPVTQESGMQLFDDQVDATSLDLAEGFDVLEDQFSNLNVCDSSDDFTSIPKRLDKMFDSFDKDGALRTMTIKTGDNMTRTRQENILTNSVTTSLSADAIKDETKRALDLLDALSRSGSLPVVSGELHVVVGVRHSFEKNVMATVIEENVNPIEKVDYSSLLIAAAVHDENISTLLANGMEPPGLALKNQRFPPSLGGFIEDGDVRTEESS